MNNKFHVKRQLQLQLGTKSFLINQEGQILLLKKDTAAHRGLKPWWEVPGGRIQSGQSLLQNLSREIKEETSISRETDVKLLGAQDICWENEYENVHCVRLTYVSRVNSATVRLSNEHTEYKWVWLDDLLKIKDLDKYLKQLLKDKAIMSFIKNYVKNAR